MSDRLSRVLHGRWLRWAVQLAALEFVTLAGPTAGALHQEHAYLSLPAYVLLALAAGAPMLSLRWPLSGWALALLATGAYYALGNPTEGPIQLGLTVALYRTAAPGAHRQSIVVGAVTSLAVMAVLVAFKGVSLLSPELLGVPGWVVAALLIGHAVSGRRTKVAREREAETQHRVNEERLRIARELHDVVSHSISVINVQAGVAAHVMDEHPEQAQEALLAIKATSKEALRELRGILGVLRQVDDAEPRAPAPGLAQLEVLVETARRAGLPISVSVQGQARPLAPAVDLAAYRIVQESLTNALRHAGPASARVSMEYTDDGFLLEVRDDGTGVPVANGSGESRPGLGISGMRERAVAAGGELEAGPLPDGGFRVRARLPVPAPAQ